MSRFLWLITKDHIYNPEFDDRPRTGVGNCNAEQDMDKMPYRWRVYDDDDDELYFEGVASERDTEEAFEPLDWASADAGATSIKYLQDDGSWETL